MIPKSKLQRVGKLKFSLHLHLAEILKIQRVNMMQIFQE